MEIKAVIDPITRIEGHLKVEIDIDSVNGVQQIVNAKMYGTLFRGFEKILQNRDPRDAQHITERICGVCPAAHGMAAVLTLDKAFGVTPPDNARIMRNLVNGSNFIDSHILHFYLLCMPDFFDKPIVAPWQPSWKIENRFSKKQNDRFIANYVKAVEMRRKAHEMGALFGGRLPHPPAYVQGGFTANPRAERIAQFKSFIAELRTFISGTYIPDARELASVYSDYFTFGVGSENLLAYGAFELDNAGTSRFFEGGFLKKGSSAAEGLNASGITELVTYSWYSDSTNNLHPMNGETMPEKPKGNAYSWLKAPRYNGYVCEVGPLARMAVSGFYKGGISVMDRHISRALEAEKLAEALEGWVNELVPDGPVYTQSSIPEKASGAGLTEAPRGALGHWIQIENYKIARYQVITPTTWNSSPRDTSGAPGAIEQALIGTPVKNADEPIEALRVIHSMDPCLDCAVHVSTPKSSAKMFAIPHFHSEEEAMGHTHSHDGGHTHTHPHSHSHPHTHPHTHHHDDSGSEE